jgi:ribosomal-protein-alanine N-acetyltransferase
MDIREVTGTDVDQLERILRESPHAAQWPARHVLIHECHVISRGGVVAGFIVSRQVGPAESEILNLAVAPEFRRQGLGRRLIRHVLDLRPGRYCLEVRESNHGARAFYESLGFRVAGRRPTYYDNPPEAAIVMASESC